MTTEQAQLVADRIVADAGKNCVVRVGPESSSYDFPEVKTRIIHAYSLYGWEVAGAASVGRGKELDWYTFENAAIAVRDYIAAHSEEELRLMSHYRAAVVGDWMAFGPERRYRGGYMWDPEEGPLYVKRSDLGAAGSPPRPD